MRQQLNVVSEAVPGGVHQRVVVVLALGPNVVELAVPGGVHHRVVVLPGIVAGVGSTAPALPL